MITMISAVIKASARFFGAPKSGLPAPPPAQRIATGSSEMPITVITVPVTTSGKKRSSRVNTGAIRKPSSAGQQERAENGRQPGRAAFLGADRQDRRDRGERGALHDRLAGADLPDAERLQQRGEAGDEQAGGHQIGDLRTAELQGAADDQRDRDDAGVHAQHVLESVQGHLRQRENLIDRVFARGRGGRWLTFHLSGVDEIPSDGMYDSVGRNLRESSDGVKSADDISLKRRIGGGSSGGSAWPATDVTGEFRARETQGEKNRGELNQRQPFTRAIGGCKTLALLQGQTLVRPGASRTSRAEKARSGPQPNEGSHACDEQHSGRWPS